ncbi:MAG: N-acetylneuraminate synthase [Proteobacteria bacterium]|nr:N-acetylneuraminate synthase [Pseudomonadota bacterium]
MDNRTWIIAEAGVNHNGSRERALALVDAAASAGADVVKFQSFRADRLATATAAKANYQEATTGTGQSQLEMLRALELSADDECAIAQACERAGITFMSTPFDAESANHLVERVGVKTLKVGSGDLTNAPLLLHLARFGLPIILSTGMSTLAEVEQALAVIAFGYTRPSNQFPRSATLASIFNDADVWRILNEQVTLLHCTTEYPAPPSSVNLRAMTTLRHAFNVPVGFSDHTHGIHFPMAAVALGAQVIEKHFTLDRNLPGPDHRASIERDDLGAMVRGIREIEAGLGNGHKVPAAEELANRAIARRCLVAATPIRTGQPFTDTNLAAKRAGDGVPPLMHWDYLGRLAGRDYEIDQPIDVS